MKTDTIEEQREAMISRELHVAARAEKHRLGNSLRDEMPNLAKNKENRLES